MNAFVRLSKLILNLNPLEFTAISIVIGYLLSDGLNSNQVQSLGNFFESIGQTLLTIGMQMQNLDSYDNKINITDKLKEFEDIIKELHLK